MIRFILADTDPMKFFFGCPEKERDFVVPKDTKVYMYDFKNKEDAKQVVPFWCADFDLIAEGQYCIGSLDLETY